MLADSLRRYLRDHYSFERRRQRAHGGIAVDPNVWAAFAETLGILGAPLSQNVGGMGGGAVETMTIMGLLGEALVTEPYLETVVVGGSLLHQAGGARAVPLLTGIAAGITRLAYALGETGMRADPTMIRTRAAWDGDGWVLNGGKIVVTAASGATQLIVAARTGGAPGERDGLSLFLVDPGTVGVEVNAYPTIDGSTAADIVFADVRLPSDALLGPKDQAIDMIERVADEAIAALCAAATGSMTQLLADTVAYTKQRRQFGATIGSFQALQHRMVDMYLALQQSIAATERATVALEADPLTRGLAAAAAKSTIGRCGRFIAENAVQLHGGMGMTDDLPVGYHFKQIMAVENRFGTADQNVTRYAKLRRVAA